MSRITVLVEGQTEERFVNVVLSPHLAKFEIYDVSAKLIGQRRERDRRGGIVSWESAQGDIRKLITEDPGRTVTTFVDYYRLPSSGHRCWPGRDSATGTSSEKAIHVERAIRDEIAKAFDNSLSPDRFVPFIMMHEFEALLFSQPRMIGEWLGKPEINEPLDAIRQSFPHPEEINDSPETAPSKRIESLVPGYQKVLHGTDIATLIGLPTIRQSCHHFDAWLTRLESSRTASA
jgi:hypothetical protein